MTSTRSAVWLQQLSGDDSSGPSLVCFAHAGGSAASFRGWNRSFPEWRLWAAKYPGRADRIAEPCETSITSLGTAVAHAILDVADGNVALFGHSMGAVVALEAAREMDRHGKPPLSLFVSGSRNGPLPKPREPAPSRSPRCSDPSDEVLTAQLRAMGGMPEDLLGNEEFRELVLPYVRGDGRMFHAYRMMASLRLGCPIVAIVGDEDADADVRPWSDLTDGGFSEHVVRGGHFYLSDAPPVDILVRHCREARAKRGAILQSTGVPA